jgi:hypothetical protein
MTVDSTFHVDTTEIRRKIYYKYGRPAVDIVTSEMRTAFQEFGTIARDEANVLIKGGKDSKLAKASKITVREGARDITAVVSWDAARSVAGFPYAAAVNNGRKAFGPIRAKFLRFEIDGKVIFTKWVKAAPAQNFTGRGLTNGRPKIIARTAKMRGNIVRRLAAPV